MSKGELCLLHSLSWNIDLLLPSDWNLYYWLSWFSQSGWNDSLALPGLQLTNCSFLDFSASIITWEPVVCVCVCVFLLLVLLLRVQLICYYTDFKFMCLLITEAFVLFLIVC